jgi:hypothetical protein
LEETLFKYQCEIEIVAILRTKDILKTGGTIHDEGLVLGNDFPKDKDVECIWYSGDCKNV